MTRNSEEIAGLVVRHLVEILGGACSITQDEIERTEEDRSLCEILTGLLFLHQDLVFRAQERKNAEDKLRAAVQLLEDRNKELETSRAALATLAAELSTPIIKLWRGVLMLPVIGSVDGHRASEMMSQLLTAVAAEKAEYVVLDLTGVSTIDTETANHFVRILGAVELLGAHGIVAGVQPSVSLSVVALGVDLRGIRTVRNVQQALAVCMAGAE